MPDPNVSDRANEVTTRGLTILYVAALATVAILTLVGQMMLRHAIEQQSLDVAIVERLSDQRLLSLSVAHDARELQYAVSPTQRRERLTQLRADADSWTRGYRDLLAFGRYPEARTHRVSALLVDLTPKQIAMAKSVQNLVLEAERVGAGANSASFVEYVDRVAGQEPGVVSSLTRLALGYEDEAAIRGADSERWESVFFIVILVVLLTESFGLLPSTVSGIRRSVDERLRAERQVLQQNTLLAERNVQLEASQAEMERANATLNETFMMIQGVSSRYTELFDNLPVACFAFDEEGRIHEWNKACEEVFGRTSEEVNFKPFFDTIMADDRVVDAAIQVRAVLTGKPATNLEWPARRPDGSIAYLLSNTFPLRGPNGSVVGGISTNIDITERRRHESQIANQLDTIEQFRVDLQEQKHELEEANARLRQMADTDTLTDLRNRRAFYEALHREAMRSKRHGHPLSILMIDVDKFKTYNDTHGHPSGDEVLRQIAAIVKAECRASDFPTRYDGDEFAVILPNTDAAGAVIAGERIRASIDEARWPKSAITVSIGAASLTQGSSDHQALIADSETAAYASKQAGRNRVTHIDATSERAAA